MNGVGDRVVGSLEISEIKGEWWVHRRALQY